MTSFALSNSFLEMKLFLKKIYTVVLTIIGNNRYQTEIIIIIIGSIDTRLKLLSSS